MPSGDAREGSDTPGRRELKECEKGRAEVLKDLLCTSAPGGRKVYGACGCGRTPLGLGGDCFLQP